MSLSTRAQIAHTLALQDALERFQKSVKTIQECRLLCLPTEVLAKIVHNEVLSDADRRNVRKAQSRLNKVVCMKGFITISFEFGSVRLTTPTKKIERFMSIEWKNVPEFTKAIHIEIGHLPAALGSLQKFARSSMPRILQKCPRLSYLKLEMFEEGVGKRLIDEEIQIMLTNICSAGIVTIDMDLKNLKRTSAVVPYLSNISNLKLEFHNKWTSGDPGNSYETGKEIGRVIANSPMLKTLTISTVRVPDTFCLETILDGVPENLILPLRKLSLCLVKTGGVSQENLAKLKFLESFTVQADSKILLSHALPKADVTEDIWNGFAKAKINLKALNVPGLEGYSLNTIDATFAYLTLNPSHVTHLTIHNLHSEFNFDPLTMQVSVDALRKLAETSALFWNEIFPTIKKNLQHLTITVDEVKWAKWILYNSKLEEYHCVQLILCLRSALNNLVPQISGSLASPSLISLRVSTIFQPNMITNSLSWLKNCLKIEDVKFTTILERPVPAGYLSCDRDDISDIDILIKEWRSVATSRPVWSKFNYELDVLKYAAGEAPAEMKTLRLNRVLKVGESRDGYPKLRIKSSANQFKIVGR